LGLPTFRVDKIVGLPIPGALPRAIYIIPLPGNKFIGITYPGALPRAIYIILLPGNKNM
jgi:hypothetical protein